MAIDPNEIGGFIAHCTNESYLLGLRAHLDARLAQLRPPGRVEEPTAEQAAEARRLDVEPVKAVAELSERRLRAAVNSAVDDMQAEVQRRLVEPVATAIDAAGNVTITSPASMEGSTSTNPGQGAAEVQLVLASEQAAQDAAEPLPSRSEATVEEIEAVKKARRSNKRKSS